MAGLVPFWRERKVHDSQKLSECKISKFGIESNYNAIENIHLVPNSCNMLGHAPSMRKETQIGLKYEKSLQFIRLYLVCKHYIWAMLVHLASHV